MDFHKRYQNLNTEQRMAVDYTEGPLLVLAGPGSGKTEILGLRAANILKKTDSPPESILCLTFTDKASVNMKERLIDLIGEDAYKIPVYTFHSFCQKIIENFPDYFYKGASFSLADQAVQAQIIEEILIDLSYDDPLSSTHTEKGFAYLQDIFRSLSDLKEGGLSPEEFKAVIIENEKVLQKINPLIDKVFQKRADKRIIPEVGGLVEELYNMGTNLPVLQHNLVTLNIAIAKSLEVALKNNNIAQWKSKKVITQDGKKVLKECRDFQKMKSLSFVYSEYQRRMHERGYYDFSDMILEVIEKMQNDESLYNEVRERYLYTLVDEFQDTNGVQMRFLNLLVEDKQDKKPNICVVGDDDQAIYRFQGADISNILDFRKKYPQTATVVLKRNYRSAGNILELACRVVKKGENRLENFYTEIKKDLVSEKKGKGTINYRKFYSEEEELSFVARKIKERLSHISPQEIVVIGRTHEDLQRALPFFKKRKIPVSYERKEDVLRNEKVLQIINILKFCNQLTSGDKSKTEELLPEILSYPFWGIDREDIWYLAQKSFREKKSWMVCMKGLKKTEKIRKFLIDLSQKSQTSPVEEVIDIVIGNQKGYYKSPFKDFYFSNDNFQKSKGDYLRNLSLLRRFVEALREHKPKENIKTKDLIEYFEIIKKNDIALLDNNPLLDEKSAVSLLTAHGAKGKEFDTVFVLNCTQGVWVSRGPGRKISLPLNLPFERAGEEKDDKLRLFYVVLSRTKKNLYLTSRGKKSDGKPLIPLEFLNDLQAKETREKVDIPSLSFLTGKSSFIPYTENEKNFLFSLVKEHKLSATGFTKFLNIVEGGPYDFLQENILRFPKKKTPSLAYGTAVHDTITEAYLYLQKTGKVMTKSGFLQVFQTLLAKERLSKKDFQKKLEQGKKELAVFYARRKNSFQKDHEVDKNFQDQDCFIGDIAITGKVDRMVKKEEEMEVTDFKTGKLVKSLQEKKIKVWQYKKQLIFYKLLIESAKDYKGFQVNKGFIEFITPDKKEEIITLPLEITKEEAERTKDLLLMVGKKIKNLEFFCKEKKTKGSLKNIENFEEELLRNKKII